MSEEQQNSEANLKTKDQQEQQKEESDDDNDKIVEENIVTNNNIEESQQQSEQIQQENDNNNSSQENNKNLDKIKQEEVIKQKKNDKNTNNTSEKTDYQEGIEEEQQPEKTEKQLQQQEQEQQQQLSETRYFAKSEWIHQQKKKSTNSPCKRWGHSAQIYHKSMFIFGGHGDSKHIRNWESVYKFDTQFYEWERIWTAGEKPEPRDSHAACVGGNFMYIFGGNEQQNDQALNDFWAFNFQTYTWSKMEQKGDIPAPREGHSLIVLSDRYILLIGGWDSKTDVIYNNIVLYDRQTCIWKEIQQKQGFTLQSRESHSVTLINDHIYLFGGQGQTVDEVDVFYNDLYKININLLRQGKTNCVFLKKVEPTTSLQPKARASHSANNFMNRYLVIIGGEGEGPEQDAEAPACQQNEKQQQQQQKSQSELKEQKSQTETEPQQDIKDQQQQSTSNIKSESKIDNKQEDGEENQKNQEEEDEEEAKLYPKNDIFIFDTELSCWLEITPQFAKNIGSFGQRFTHSSCVYKDLVIIFGGMQTTVEKLDDLMILKLKDEDIQDSDQELRNNNINNNEVSTNNLDSVNQLQKKNNQNSISNENQKQLCHNCSLVFGVSNWLSYKGTTREQELAEIKQQKQQLELQQQQFQQQQQQHQLQLQNENSNSRMIEEKQEQPIKSAVEVSQTLQIDQNSQTQPLEKEKETAAPASKYPKYANKAQLAYELEKEEEILKKELRNEGIIPLGVSEASIGFFSQVAQQIKYPFAAFGLIYDSARIIKTQNLNINLLRIKRGIKQEQETPIQQHYGQQVQSEISHQFISDNFIFFQITDDSEGYTPEQFTHVLYKLDTQSVLDDDDLNYSEDQLYKYRGCLTKLGAFRIGNTILMISKNKEKGLLSVGFISSIPNKTVDMHKMIFFMFVYNPNTKKFVSQQGELHKQIIVKYLQDYMSEEQLLQGHSTNGNYTYIFDLQTIPKPGNQIAFEFQYNPESGDLLLNKQGVPKYKHKQYINHMVDFSLHTYLSYLYLDPRIEEQQTNIYLNGKVIEIKNYSDELAKLESSNAIRQLDKKSYDRQISEIGEVHIFEPIHYISNSAEQKQNQQKITQQLLQKDSSNNKKQSPLKEEEGVQQQQIQQKSKDEEEQKNNDNDEVIEEKIEEEGGENLKQNNEKSENSNKIEQEEQEENLQKHEKKINKSEVKSEDEEQKNNSNQQPNNESIVNSGGEEIEQENQQKKYSKDLFLGQQGILLYYNRRLIGRAETENIGYYFLQKVMRKTKRFHDDSKNNSVSIKNEDNLINNSYQFLRYSGYLKLSQFLKPNVYQTELQNPFYSQILYTNFKTFFRQQKQKDRNLIQDMIAQKSLTGIWEEKRQQLISQEQIQEQYLSQQKQELQEKENSLIKLNQDIQNSQQEIQEQKKLLLQQQQLEKQNSNDNNQQQQQAGNQNTVNTEQYNELQQKYAQLQLEFDNFKQQQQQSILIQQQQQQQINQNQQQQSQTQQDQQQQQQQFIQPQQKPASTSNLLKQQQQQLNQQQQQQELSYKKQSTSDTGPKLTPEEISKLTPAEQVSLRITDNDKIRSNMEQCLMTSEDERGNQSETEQQQQLQMIQKKEPQYIDTSKASSTYQEQQQNLQQQLQQQQLEEESNNNKQNDNNSNELQQQQQKEEVEQESETQKSQKENDIEQEKKDNEEQQNELLSKTVIESEQNIQQQQLDSVENNNIQKQEQEKENQQEEKIKQQQQLSNDIQQEQQDENSEQKGQEKEQNENENKIQEKTTIEQNQAQNGEEEEEEDDVEVLEEKEDQKIQEEEQQQQEEEEVIDGENPSKKIKTEKDSNDAENEEK